MPRSKSAYICLFILCLGIAGCTRNTEIVPEFEEGYIAGYVHCLDEFGNQVNPEYVEVTVYGSPVGHGTTDSEGFYRITAPIGYQHIIFQKEGFGSHHLQDQLIIGGHVPVVYNAALLCKPVDAEVTIDSTGLSDSGTYIYVAGKATSDTPFDLVMACYAEGSPDEMLYLWLGTFDEPGTSGYSCTFTGTAYLGNFSASTQAVHAAICCQNAWDHVRDEGGTLKRVTNYMEINLSE